MIAFPDHYGEFLKHLGDKLHKGQQTYGSASFCKTERELLTELQSEAIDLAGWGYVLWAKLENIKKGIPEDRCHCHVKAKEPMFHYEYEWDDAYPTGKTVVHCDESKDRK